MVKNWDYFKWGDKVPVGKAVGDLLYPLADLLDLPGTKDDTKGPLGFFDTFGRNLTEEDYKQLEYIVPALVGTGFLYFALHPQSIQAVLDGTGNILKGIGEIVPDL